MDNSTFVVLPTGRSNVPTFVAKSSRSFSEVYFVLLALVNPIWSNIKQFGANSVDFTPIPTINLTAGKNDTSNTETMYTVIDISQNVINMNNEQTIKNTADIESIQKTLLRMESKLDQLPTRVEMSHAISSEVAKSEVRIKDDNHKQWQDLSNKIIWVLVTTIGAMIGIVLSNFDKILKLFTPN